MHEEMMIAGFGGQGVLLIGQLIAQAALVEDKNVLWMPAYGPETRGGFANCTVMVSDSDIYSPVTTEPTAMIVMNLPSLNKFERSVKEGGFLFVNKSLVNREVFRNDIDSICVPVTEIARDLGNVKAANMVALGGFIAKKPIVEFKTLIDCLPKVFKGTKEKLIPFNKEALLKGAEYVKGL